MQRQERISLIVDAVNQVKAAKYEDAGFAILIDQDHDDNYVQFAKRDGGTAIFEVTSRDYERGILPAVSEEQANDIGALGFDPYPSPNFRQIISLSDPWEIAEISEQAFMILGSLPDFHLKVEFGDLGDG